MKIGLTISCEIITKLLPKSFVPATKIGESTNSIFEYYFAWKIYTLAHQTIFIQKSKFTSHKQYSLGLTFSRIPKKIIQTKYTTSFFTLSEKKRLTNFQNKQQQITFSIYRKF